MARYKKVVSVSNFYYNDGLEKANVRDLSGAVVSLTECLKLNKMNIEARNLLGLVYFEMGETVDALSEWVISKNLQPEKNIADAYIEAVQNSPSQLENLNQAIKKYNQALVYCRQGSLDLALIQLRKVLSINSKFHWFLRDAGTTIIIRLLCSAHSSERIMPASIVLPKPTSSAKIAPLLSGDLNANKAASTW